MCLTCGDAEENPPAEWVKGHIEFVLQHGKWETIFDSKASEFKDPSPLPWGILWLVLSALILLGCSYILSLIPS